MVAARQRATPAASSYAPVLGCTDVVSSTDPLGAPSEHDVSGSLPDLPSSSATTGEDQQVVHRFVVGDSSDMDMIPEHVPDYYWPESMEVSQRSPKLWNCCSDVSLQVTDLKYVHFDSERQLFVFPGLRTIDRSLIWARKVAVYNGQVALMCSCQGDHVVSETWRIISDEGLGVVDKIFLTRDAFSQCTHYGAFSAAMLLVTGHELSGITGDPPKFMEFKWSR
jgi:hypothetical protein